MTCIKQILSRSPRSRVGRLLAAAFTSCRCFHAELVRSVVYWTWQTRALIICDLTVNPLTSQVRRESSRLPIVHHSQYVCELPPNHRFPMGKFPRVLRSLIKDQVITEEQVSDSFIFSTEEIQCFHHNWQLTANLLMIIVLSPGFISLKIKLWTVVRTNHLKMITAI